MLRRKAAAPPTRPTPTVYRNEPSLLTPDLRPSSVITIPPGQRFYVPAPDAPAAAPSTVMTVNTVTVLAPGPGPASTPPVPTFTVQGTVPAVGGGGEADFYDNPVQFTDISVIPRGLAALREAVQAELAFHAAAATGTGTVIPVDFTGRSRSRSSSRSSKVRS